MSNISIEQTIANLPSKLYFSIKEVATICGEDASVLRYWEKEFSQLKPRKVKTQRRYQKKDITIILHIKELLRGADKISIAEAKNQIKTSKTTPQINKPNNTNINIDILLDIKARLQKLLKSL